jgi:type I restriction enzyme R subunit
VIRGPEYEFVELPLVEQLVGMGWSHVAGSTSDPQVTGRAAFREVLLEGRLRAALTRINLGPDGEPWLDEGRLAQAVAALTRPRATKLVEVNEELTDAILLGTTVDGVPGWEHGRSRTVAFVDWRHPERNEFLVVNQFRVDLPGGQGGRFVTPDLVLFVNGIPLVVIEAKSPTSAEPIAAAIRQLARYADQRGAERPEGNERLFHTNQFVVATSFDVAKAGTFTSDADHFAEWKTTEPTREADVAAALGVQNARRLSSQQRLVAGMLAPDRLLDIVRHFTLFMPADGRTVKVVARYQQYRAARRAVARLAAGATRAADGEADRRGGIVWHTQGSGKSLTMVFLVRAMRTHPQLVRFKIVVVTDRTDLQKQLAATAALTGETVGVAKTVAEVREMLAAPGKALAFAMIQKYRNPAARRADDAALKTLGVLDTSSDVLVLVDEAHRSQGNALHASLLTALPNCARIGFTGTPIIMGKKKYTHSIFGDYLDRYTIVESQADGATVPIRYEGRTTASAVRDADDLDELFEDMFADRSPDELEAIKRRWATKGDVLEAPSLIAAKARNMLRHYVDAVLPGGFKAQVVAASRLAAVRYRDAFRAARDELLAELDALDPALRTPRAADDADQLPRRTARLVRAWPLRDTIAALDFIPVISAGENDDASWARWSDPARQAATIEAFRRPLPGAGGAGPAGGEAGAQAGETSPIAILIVKSMLLTGFDAPREQALYLDRSIREAELLQAIARVNRTKAGKAVGYVVDYYGVAEHLKVALAAYAAEDVDGALAGVGTELPLLAERHQRVRALFRARGVDLFDSVRLPSASAGGGEQHPTGFGDAADQAACVELLADEALRAAFEAALKQFTTSLEIVLPRPEALPYVADAKAFGAIAFAARRRYRDESGFDVSVYGAKVRRLIDDHIEALGISTKIPPISITDADFDAKVADLPSARAKASEMEHAIRHHLREHLDTDPEHHRRLSERLEEIIAELGDQWDQLALALADFLPEVRAERAPDDIDLTAVELPFYDLLRRERAEHGGRGGEGEDGEEVSGAVAELLRELTIFLVEHIRSEIVRVGFWRNAHAQNALRGWIATRLADPMIDGEDLFEFERTAALADRLVELAKANHAALAVAGSL